MQNLLNLQFDSVTKVKVCVNCLNEFTINYPGQLCSHLFVTVQNGEHRPFIEEILTRLPTIICDLTPGQVQTFYEAVGHMISGEEDNLVRDNFIERLMALPNTVRVVKL